ncbi:DUF190 domain-containing protein [Desulfovibrio legallii]|jgi:PII-like signaling protein|uniref:PII-like signaling protein n=1 Tax=Desulfovibrio legallii TaxID=571438 RepID=A0A1G7QGN8_9BACT|nr:DUF190 domain-containing protein [Desulfovibrio legallii]SDF97119.1 PII-like signaling protein [Desulfovibrio legallii]
MQGYQIVFFTQQERSHGALSVAEWLLATARALGIKGATVSAAQGGYGRDGAYRTTRFFETGEQPVEVTMAVSPEHCRLLFERIRAEKMQIFYVKIPAEFGLTGEADATDGAE